MSNEVLTLCNTFAISHEKIRNQGFPRISKMLPLAIFYSPPQIEISRRFYQRPWLRPAQRRIIPTQMIKKQPTQCFSTENNFLTRDL